MPAWVLVMVSLGYSIPGIATEQDCGELRDKIVAAFKAESVGNAMLPSPPGRCYEYNAAKVIQLTPSSRLYRARRVPIRGS